MRFKLLNCTFNISFSFFALLILMMISINKEYYLAALGSAVIHECGHIFVSFCCKERIKEIQFSLYGLVIVKDGTSASVLRNILILIFGPLFNIFTASFMLLLKCFQMKISDYFIISNILLALFNLLPISNLDGGSIFEQIIAVKTDTEKTVKVTSFVSLITSVTVFLILFIYTLGKSLNIFIIIFMFYILFNGVFLFIKANYS